MLSEQPISSIEERWEYSKFLKAKYSKLDSISNPHSSRLREIVVFTPYEQLLFRFNYDFPAETFIESIKDNLEFFDVIDSTINRNRMGVTLIFKLRKFNYKNIWLLNEYISILYNEMIEDLENKE